MQALFSQTDIISQCPLVMYPTHSSGQYLGQYLVEFIAQNKIFARATSDLILLCILRLNTHVQPQTQYPCATSDSIPMCNLRLNTHVQTQTQYPCSTSDPIPMCKLRLNTDVQPQTQYACATSDSIPMCNLRLNTHVQLLIDEYNAVSSHYISSQLVLRLIFNNLWLLKRILLKQRP